MHSSIFVVDNRTYNHTYVHTYSSGAGLVQDKIIYHAGVLRKVIMIILWPSLH